MSNVVLTTGMILKDPETCKKYRIISIYDSNIVLCEMDIKKLVLFTLQFTIVLDLYSNEKLKIEKENVPVFDIKNLSSSVRSNYETMSVS